MSRKERRAAARQGATPKGPGIRSAKIAGQFAAALRHHRASRLVEAKHLYEEICRVDPTHFGSLHHLGLIAHQLGRVDAAVDLIGRALALEPNHAEAHHSLADALVDQGKPAEAVPHYERALALKPNLAETHNNLGSALKIQGKLAEAVTHYERALALAPGYAEAHNNLGNALQAQGRLAEAVVHYGRALALRPDDADAHVNLATALQKQGKLAGAIAGYRHALALRPRHADAHYNLGTALQRQEKVPEALAQYERTLALKPDHAEARSNLIFALNFIPDANFERQQAERKRYGAEHAGRFAAAMRPHPNQPDPERRLRIGYVSAHFRSQAATYAFGGVLLNHDREQFEVVCYSDTSREDEITARLRASVASWRDVRGQTDEALAALVRQDRIDILVDLVGHMSGHRLLVFARKPAPVQVTGWGEPTGTGLSTMDYLLADPVLVPMRERHLLAERVADLPCFLGYWAPEDLPDAGPLPAKADGRITFGSFNRVAKLTQPTLEAWAEVLQRMPSSRLVLKSRGLEEPAEQTRIRTALAAWGVPADRVSFLGATTRPEHFTAYREIDIALDPFPHGGGVTTLDALWMGVPVVTWGGRTISSRLAAATLSALGLNEFIASDPASYVDLAAGTASDLPKLARLRSELRARVAASELGDPARYARAVEAAYRALWRRWCAQR